MTLVAVATVTTTTISPPNMVEKWQSSPFQQDSIEIQPDLPTGSTRSGVSRPDPKVGSSTSRSDPATWCAKSTF
ncbi:Uncharacterized protein TCM_036322 [Theobroma cacao]|uniref:Uncharacterized protein n=1 Tax=Theobroma cacao TaxID=3641 RepID=A0A061FKJ4_THECC|nr:Uncharacterized protein TCM_036322 [Theobroma cacao]